MEMTVRATVLGLKNIFPESSITIGGNHWKNGIGDYFYIEEELTKTSNNLCKRALKNPKFLYNLFAIALKKATNFKTFTEQQLKSGVLKKDTKKLLNFVEKSSKKYYEMYSYATVAALVGYKDDNLLYTKMQKILQKKTKNDLEKLSRYLMILTKFPKQLNISLKQDLAILKLALRAKKQNLKTQKSIKKTFYKKIKKIQNEFQWLSFDICDKVSDDIKHFTELIVQKARGNPKEEINGLKNYEETTNKNFNDVCKKLLLTKKERDIFELVRNTGYQKWAREYEFVKAIYNVKLVQDEIGKRIGLSTLETKYLFVNELKQAVKYPKKMKELAKSRFKNCLILVDKNKGTICYKNTQAKKEYSKLKFMQEDKNYSKEIKGTTAYLGKVKGIVKKVNTAQHLYKMEQGNILISHATIPELLSGMKKAGAIITNEGGITCHAAIVSRELKTPCIVGTKNVTKVLKDGDLVEVDANKGVVKIIKN